jgi:hypothetical protein
MMELITPMGYTVRVSRNGEIEGDFEALAGWVRSGSKRDQDNWMRWYLFLQEWQRQKHMSDIAALDFVHR